MKRFHLKRFLREEIPDIDYRLAKEKTLNRISYYEEKHRKQGLYFMPKVGLSLLGILMSVNVYSLIQEVLFNMGSRKLSVGDVMFSRLYSGPFVLKSIAAFGDNLLAIVLTVSLALLVNRRFLGLYKITRTLKVQLVFLKNLILRIPGLALTLMRRP